MNNNISKLQPNALWGHFSEILNIPRPSKKEEKIAAYLVDFANKHKLDCRQDEIGNVLITKPPTKGMESKKSVCLQSHLDMVCEKNTDKKFDFDKDPIQAYIDGDWVKALGTTLGADDGIGIATQMAILESKEIAHGPIECLFTVDEETGLSGAFALTSGFLTSDILLNLDSEDDGQIFIGCAGGRDTVARFGFKKELVPDWNLPFKIVISGLKGGHSGDDINKGLGNANKILVRILHQATQTYGIRLHHFNGGNLRNAIAREAEATVLINQALRDKFLKLVEHFNQVVRKEFKTTEPDMQVKAFQVDPPYFVIDEKSQHNLINALYSCPHGVIQMSREIQNFVETSTNLASVKTLDDSFQVTTSQRSSVASALDDVVNMVAATFKLINADIEHSDGYPGWTPNPDSEVLVIAKDAYQKLFNAEPKILAVHAGLECGLIGEKYPGMDMISYGPDIKGAHSPDERIHIKSVDKFWKWTLEILKNIPDKT
ncbi:MAG: aminoacyl-histidine dipeptidase [Bacteroidales bacterium]|nr:aminoacyl-histidine dipeptidase [Bacteroidales bacterium]